LDGNSAFFDSLNFLVTLVVAYIEYYNMGRYYIGVVTYLPFTRCKEDLVHKLNVKKAAGPADAFGWVE